MELRDVVIVCVKGVADAEGGTGVGMCIWKAQLLRIC